MNGRTLVVLGLVGVAVAAYAVVTLMQPRESLPDEAVEAVATAPADVKSAPRPAAGNNKPSPNALTKKDRPETLSRPVLTDPPANAEESEDAKRYREELSELFDRIDAVIKRGDTMPQDEWQQAYMDGTNAIHNLAKELGSGPNAVEEINEYHTDLRHKLAKVEDIPGTP